MNLPQFSVKNPVAVNLLMWAIIIGGAYYAFNLVRELFPTSEPELISVNVVYPGASPEDVEKSITRRLEREVEDIEGIEEIRSGSVAVEILPDDWEEPEVEPDFLEASDPLEPPASA